MDKSFLVLFFKKEPLAFLDAWQKESAFFFEKKNQKTFMTLVRV
jgi:hypothetical protein